jgi:hypothetical protein
MTNREGGSGHGSRRISADMTHRRTVAATLLATLLLAGGARAEAPQPAPPYPPYPPARTRPLPPRRAYPPPVVAAPPPLSPVTRAIYAPFYAAGLVVRYGVYYVLVAPIEVFARTISYGVKGGVEPPPPVSRRAEDAE